MGFVARINQDLYEENQLAKLYIQRGHFLPSNFIQLFYIHFFFEKIVDETYISQIGEINSQVLELYEQDESNQLPASTKLVLFDAAQKFLVDYASKTQIFKEICFDFMPVDKLSTYIAVWKFGLVSGNVLEKELRTFKR